LVEEMAKMNAELKSTRESLGLVAEILDALGEKLATVEMALEDLAQQHDEGRVAYPDFGAFLDAFLAARDRMVAEDREGGE
jgi:hypothetical protein